MTKQPESPKPQPASTPSPNPKRPRTESPETLATRALRIRRQLHERLDAEIARHTAKRVELSAIIQCPR
jgi:hypothetical protein